MSDLPKKSESGCPRPRSMTSLCLDWLAERMRRADRIKTQISEGSYRVNSEAVAQSLMNHGPPP